MSVTMKFKFLILISCTISNSFISSQQPIINNTLELKFLGNFEPELTGIGYSSDSAFLAPTYCYNAVSIQRGEQTSELVFDMGVSIEKITQSLNIQAQVSGGYGQFSGNAMFNYIHELEENNYSISINYRFKVLGSVKMAYSYNPLTILNETGKAIYADGTNPMFRLFCGDRLVTSYEEGALLIFSISIVFSDSSQKDTFTSQIGAKLGSFLDASAKITAVCDEYNLNGKINVKGFQLGGDPTKLSALLSGQITECTIKNIAACQSTIAGMIKYSQENFSNQFTKEGLIWKGPLVPIGSYSLDFFVSDFGLKLSASFVSEEIKEIRYYLLEQYDEIKKLIRRNENMLVYYPIEICQDAKNALIDDLTKYKNTLNLHFENQGLNSLDCWKMPARCLQIKQNYEIKEYSKENPILEYIERVIIVNPLGTADIHGIYWPNGCGGKSENQKSYIFAKIFTPPSSNRTTSYLVSSTLTEISLFPDNTIGLTGEGTHNDNPDDCDDQDFIFKIDCWFFPDKPNYCNINKHVILRGVFSICGDDEWLKTEYSIKLENNSYFAK